LKKKIPELLECDDEIVISGEDRKRFDPEEIKELTMKKIHQNETSTNHSRRFTTFLLAAALAAALTATAFAAYHFIIAEQFDGYFGNLTEQQAEVMEQIGICGMPASTANGTTLTPLAVIGDSGHCYAKFRVEAPEGTQLQVPDEQTGYLQIFGDALDEWYTLVDEAGKEIPISSSRTEWIDTVSDDNTLEFIVRFDSDMDAPARFNDGESKILTIKGIWQQGTDKDYTKLLDGPWSFDIGFYSSVSERTLDVDGLPVKRMFDGVEYEDEGTSITLRAMSISPLALSYTYDFTCPDPDQMIPGPQSIS